MQILYNLIQLALVPLFILILPFYLISKPQKRDVIFKRLGIGLSQPGDQNKLTVWIHALSVGEVTSAYSLVKSLYQSKGSSINIVFSTTTATGHQLAQKLMVSYCDQVILYPFDFYPLVRRFQKKIKPDLFILIETDFWPNFLHRLSRKGVPCLLFNGRISRGSMQRYLRFSFFFKPLFDTFSLLCMQTEADARNMHQLGLDMDKLKVLGNLKFSDEGIYQMEQDRGKSPFPSNKFLVFGGSTHANEEEILIDAMVSLQGELVPVHLVLAPRDIQRSQEVAGLVSAKGLSFSYFSDFDPPVSEVTIVDTIGDLSRLYQYADISFIGGSLVQEGGHNPLEAARCSCPVLFGPHMEDFSEIGEGLVEAGGAVVVQESDSLRNVLQKLLVDADARRSAGESAGRYTLDRQSVLVDHLHVIYRYL